MDPVAPQSLVAACSTWVLCGLAGAAIIALGCYLRITLGSTQARFRLEGRLAERERIARELHDTLLQGVQGLVLQFQAITEAIPVQDASRIALEDTLFRADELLAESRARIRALRTTSVSAKTLIEALAAEGAQLTANLGVHFSVSAEGSPRVLHAIVHEEALLIGREALVNALLHSKATRIEADLHYGGSELRLRVRDNGCGIVAAGTAASREHWGLVGMQERAKKMRGQLNIWSAPNEGTEIDLRVPASVAYGLASGTASLSWWTRIRRAIVVEAD